MKQKILNVFKKIGKVYLDSVVSYYKPLIDYKINPLI